MTMNNYCVFRNVFAAVSAWDICVNNADKNKYDHPAYDRFDKLA